MAIVTNYGTLVQSILDFSHKSNIAAFVDYFIQGAQDQFNNDIFDRNEGNGIRYMESAFTATINATTGLVAVPSDWLAPKDIQVVQGNAQIGTLSFKSVPWLYSNYPNRAPSGLPAYMARENSNFIFGPFPDSAYILQGTYYALAPLLTSAAPTNWMVTSTPLHFQAACMMKAALFLRDTELLQTWGTIYEGLLGPLVDRDKAERWAMATMAIELG
jgi:hypothetical protein